MLHVSFHFIFLFLLFAYHLSCFFLTFCSYCGAQIFEIYGLGKDIVDLSFRGSVCKIGGLTFDEVSQRSIKHLSFSVEMWKHIYFLITRGKHKLS